MLQQYSHNTSRASIIIALSAYMEKTTGRIRQITSSGSALWDSIAAEPLMATVSLDIPDKTGKKKLQVEAELRYHQIEILRPVHNKDSYESVTLTAIEIKEKNSKDKNEEDIIHWKLLTTVEINKVSDALKCVKWYTFRWLIERFHYVFKEWNQNRSITIERCRKFTKSYFGI